MAQEALGSSPSTSQVTRPGLVRRLYNWVLSLAETPWGIPALALLAFAESSFFPIPPDVLLLALCLGAPRKSLQFALICAIFSVLGGIGGYYIGYALEPVGRWIITHVASAEKFDLVAGYYRDDAFFYVVLAAFTPIPYKVFTIAAGMFHEVVPLSTLVMASVVGRSARFFLVAGLVYKFGPPVKQMIDKYFDRLMWAFLILLVLGFAAIKYLGGHKPLTEQTAMSALTSAISSERRFMVARIETAASRTFGYNPDLPPGHADNEAALSAIRDWLQTLPTDPGH